MQCSVTNSNSCPHVGFIFNNNHDRRATGHGEFVSSLVVSKNNRDSWPVLSPAGFTDAGGGRCYTRAVGFTRTGEQLLRFVRKRCWFGLLRYLFSLFTAEVIVVVFVFGLI